MPAQRGGPADVVYVLCLMQAGFILLAGLGEMVLMGANPLYLVMPVVKMVVLFVVAAKVVSGRRWAMITLIVVQAITLGGFWVQLVLGFLPMLDFTLNLVGLITNLGLPVVVIYVCASMFVRSGRVRPPVAPQAGAWYGWPAPQDPYAPAPLVTSATVPEVFAPYAVVPTAILPRDASR